MFLEINMKQKAKRHSASSEKKLLKIYMLNFLKYTYDLVALLSLLSTIILSMS